MSHEVQPKLIKHRPPSCSSFKYLLCFRSGRSVWSLKWNPKQLDQTYIWERVHLGKKGLFLYGLVPTHSPCFLVGFVVCVCFFLACVCPVKESSKNIGFTSNSTPTTEPNISPFHFHRIRHSQTSPTKHHLEEKERPGNLLLWVPDTSPSENLRQALSV